MCRRPSNTEYGFLRYSTIFKYVIRCQATPSFPTEDDWVIFALATKLRRARRRMKSVSWMCISYLSFSDWHIVIQINVSTMQMSNLNKQHCIVRFEKCSRPKIDYDVLMLRARRTMCRNVESTSVCAPQHLICALHSPARIQHIWPNMHHARMYHTQDVWPEPCTKTTAAAAKKKAKSPKFVRWRSTKRQLMLSVSPKIEVTKNRIASTATYCRRFRNIVEICILFRSRVGAFPCNSGRNLFGTRTFLLNGTG